MIDLHAHILPGLDDGSQVMEDSLMMAELALEGGVDTLVVTPHSNQEGRFENYNQKALKDVYEEFVRTLKEENIPLKVFQGMEIMASYDVCDKIMNNRVIGLNHSSYYLIEFPFDEDPYLIGSCLQEILEIGKVPLIAHPERYFCAQKCPMFIFEWLKMGCLTQMNRGSLFGKFGRHTKHLAELMMEYDLVTCVASDAHSPYVRTTFMGDVREYLADRYGEERMYRLLEGNPGRILYDQRIPVHGSPMRKRHYFI